MTPSDAVFVAKMIRTMHDLGTNGFTTVFAYMQVRIQSQGPRRWTYLTCSSSMNPSLLAFSLVQRVKPGTLVSLRIAKWRPSKLMT
jgi:hypothetical protein